MASHQPGGLKTLQSVSSESSKKFRNAFTEAEDFKLLEYLVTDGFSRHAGHIFGVKVIRDFCLNHPEVALRHTQGSLESRRGHLKQKAMDPNFKLCGVVIAKQWKDRLLQKRANVKSPRLTRPVQLWNEDAASGAFPVSGIAQGPLIGQNGHKSPVLTTFLEEAAEVRQRAQSSVVTRAVVPVFSQFFSQDTAPPQQQLHVLTSYLSSSKTTTASYEQTILKRRRLEDAEQQHKQARSAFVSLGKKLESAAQSLINKRKNQNATDPQEKLQKLTDLRNMATASIRLTAMGNEIWKDQVRLQMKRERLNWETDHSKV